jgi:hypothetical protein
LYDSLVTFSPPITGINFVDSSRSFFSDQLQLQPLSESISINFFDTTFKLDCLKSWWCFYYHYDAGGSSAFVMRTSEHFFLSGLNRLLCCFL